MWRNHVDGGGVGFRIDLKHLREAKASALIVCSLYDVFQLSRMY